MCIDMGQNPKMELINSFTLAFTRMEAKYVFARARARLQTLIKIEFKWIFPFAFYQQFALFPLPPLPALCTQKYAKHFHIRHHRTRDRIKKNKNNKCYNWLSAAQFSRLSNELNRLFMHAKFWCTTAKCTNHAYAHEYMCQNAQRKTLLDLLFIYVDWLSYTFQFTVLFYFCFFFLGGRIIALISASGFAQLEHHSLVANF